MDLNVTTAISPYVSAFFRSGHVCMHVVQGTLLYYVRIHFGTSTSIILYFIALDFYSIANSPCFFRVEFFVCGIESHKGVITLLQLYCARTDTSQRKIISTPRCHAARYAVEMVV